VRSVLAVTVLVGLASLALSGCSKSDLEQGNSAQAANDQKTATIVLKLPTVHSLSSISGPRLKDSQAWKELRATYGWASPRLATPEERERARPCIQRIEADRRERWDDSNLEFHPRSLRVGDWGEQSLIGFVESSIKDQPARQNSALWMLDLSICEVINAEYETNTIDIELVGAQAGDAVRVVYNNPRGWNKDIKFLPRQKRLYKRTWKRVEDVAFVETPEAAKCGAVLVTALPDQSIKRLCDIEPDDLRVKTYYEYLAVYDFAKEALDRYHAIPDEVRPVGQRVLALDAGDAVVSTFSKKHEARGQTPYPLDLQYTYTTNYDAD